MSRWLVAMMTGALFVALVVAVTGFQYLMTGSPVIREPDASPYLGPAMVAGATVVVVVATGVGARRGSPAVTALVAAAAGYLVMLGIGAIAYALVRGDVAQLVVFPAGYALGPFVVGAAASALVSVAGGIALVRAQNRAPHGTGVAGSR
jgi:hypothetical protein